MQYVIFDKKYRFKSFFDTEKGTYVRSNVFDLNGKETNEEPFMASFPHTIDIGIMGHCIHGESGLCAKAGIGCYQSGQFIKKENMKLEDFESICKQCEKKSTQFALGGRGDPDCHENFEEILQLARKYNIVPNYTTSGLLMNDKKAEISKKYCGAVGVSWYRSDYTFKAINTLLKYKNKVNIHYVLSNSTIDEAIELLKNDSYPDGVNAVIFLLHKPVGQGSEEDVLKVNDPRVKEFVELFQKPHKCKMGLDSCLVPALFSFGKDLVVNAIDSCESGRFSCCIEPDMMMLPCSFDQARVFGVSLLNSTIQEAWESKSFEDFRDILRKACPNCKIKALCYGGCPLKKQIVLCNKKRRVKI